MARIDLRCTKEEKNEIAARAQDAGFPVSEFLRQAGLKGRVVVVPSVNGVQWVRLAGAMSNLNQLVHLCHEGRVSPELLPHVVQCRTLVQEIRKELVP